jgi:hypothetical protein
MKKFLLSIPALICQTFFYSSVESGEVCPEINGSRWRQNVYNYVKEMEELQRKKPGYPGRLNTYDPCRPVMEDLNCNRKMLKEYFFWKLLKNNLV